MCGEGIVYMYVHVKWPNALKWLCPHANSTTIITMFSLFAAYLQRCLEVLPPWYAWETAKRVFVPVH